MLGPLFHFRNAAVLGPCPMNYFDHEGWVLCPSFALHDEWVLCRLHLWSFLAPLQGKKKGAGPKVWGRGKLGDKPHGHFWVTSGLCFRPLNNLFMTCSLSFGSYFYIFSNSFIYGSLAHAFIMFVMMRKQLGQTSSISSFFFFGHLSSTLDIESSLVYPT